MVCDEQTFQNLCTYVVENKFDIIDLQKKLGSWYCI